MIVTLTPELEQAVQERLASGLYTSATAVVSEAMRLLQQRDELRHQQHEQLRAEIRAGVEQIKQGQYSTYASADELITEIVTAGQQRLAEKQRAAGQ